jgi:hypothetical protein
MYSPDDLDALAGFPFDPDRPVDRATLAASARDGILSAPTRTLSDLVYSGTTITDEVYGDEWDAQLDALDGGAA